MAIILDQRYAIDGYDVRFLAAGQAHVLHFGAQPDQATLAEALRQFEMRMLDDAARQIGREEGKYVLYDL